MGLIEFVLGILAVILILGLVGLIKLIQAISNNSQRQDELHHTEARTLQQLHQQLKSMEERVNTLETLLLEEEKQRKSKERELETL
jgi:phage shock protein B